MPPGRAEGLLPFVSFSRLLIVSGVFSPSGGTETELAKPQVRWAVLQAQTCDKDSCQEAAIAPAHRPCRCLPGVPEPDYRPDFMHVLRLEVGRADHAVTRMPLTGLRRRRHFYGRFGSQQPVAGRGARGDNW